MGRIKADVSDYDLIKRAFLDIETLTMYQEAIEKSEA